MLKQVNQLLIFLINKRVERSQITICGLKNKTRKQKKPTRWEKFRKSRKGIREISSQNSFPSRKILFRKHKIAGEKNSAKGYPPLEEKDKKGLSLIICQRICFLRT